jgi:hypothetical protein
MPIKMHGKPVFASPICGANGLFSLLRERTERDSDRYAFGLGWEYTCHGGTYSSRLLFYKGCSPSVAIYEIIRIDVDSMEAHGMVVAAGK